MNTQNNSERGQAIIFLVLGLVVFMGFVGLAIDGGMAMADQREAQNVSDSSALSAAGLAALELENRHVYYTQWNCNSADVQAAIQVGQTSAIARAASNGVEIDDDVTDFNGVIAECGQDTLNGYTDRWIDFTVHISDTAETSFIQLFFPSAVNIRTDAVTRVRPRAPLAFGNAIVALNPDGCQGHQNGAIFYGNANSYVNGGGIWTNGCLRTNGNPYIEVTGGAINYVGELSGGNGLHPDPTKVNDPIPPSSYEVPAPDCNHPDAHNVTSSWLLSHSPLEPGLYCIEGDLRFNGNDELVGNEVTLYLLDGGIRINGNCNIQLSAPPYNPDPSPAIPGIVIYMDPSNHSELKINGASDSYWIGTILAPGADIDMNGTGYADSYHTQIIGWNVQVGGTADLWVTFEESRLYTKPTSMELYR
jgi:Flp pilus assembly protein TadG